MDAGSGSWPLGDHTRECPTLVADTSLSGRRVVREPDAVSSLAAARIAIVNWKEDYNNDRPHSALGNIPQAAFATKIRLEMQAT
jgi:transposase InsO family protein